MKKSILTLVAGTIISGTIIVSCTSSAKKVEKAQENVAEANKDLEKANNDYLAEIIAYRKETADKIAANNLSAIEFNNRITNEKKEAKADYKKKVSELEQKNSDMKKKMDDYKETTKENWESFKIEFNHDMDELGKAFKDLTVKNTK